MSGRKRRLPPVESGRRKRRKIDTRLDSAEPELESLQSGFTRAKRTRTRLSANYPQLMATQKQAERDERRFRRRIESSRKSRQLLHKTGSIRQVSVLDTQKSGAELERDDLSFQRKAHLLEPPLLEVERRNRLASSLTEVLESKVRATSVALVSLVEGFLKNSGFSVTVGISDIATDVDARAVAERIPDLTLVLDCAFSFVRRTTPGQDRGRRRSGSFRFLLVPLPPAPPANTNRGFLYVPLLTTTEGVVSFTNKRLGTMFELAESDVVALISGIKNELESSEG